MQEIDLAGESGLGPIKTNRFGEAYFYNLNRNNFDKISAQALFDGKFAGDLFEEDALNVVIGTDSGLLPRYVQQRGIPKGSRYIFVEADDVLAELIHGGHLGDLDARIACIDLESWAATANEFKVHDYCFINSVRSFNALCAEDDYIYKYAELSWHVTEMLSQLHWQCCMELGSEAFIAKQLINVADNLQPANVLKQAFRGKTAVLLAGGPSLDEALPWVKQHRAQLVVLAVSRIARQLLQNRIEPDFVFSVDPTELSFDISKEMLSFGERPIFVYSYHTSPLLVSQWRGPALYLGERLPWNSPLNVTNLTAAGPTVTNTALNVAHGMGCKRVILAGVDLCFTRDGFTHAKGSNEHLAGPRFDLTSLQVETNDGFMAPTSCDFLQAIQSLALQARVFARQGMQIVNPSANAAKIADVEYVSFDQIVLEAECLDARELIMEKLQRVPNDKRYQENVLQELRRAHFQVSAIAKLAESARQINDAMYNEQGVIERFQDKKSLDRIEKKFKREYRAFSKLVKKFGIRRFIKLAKPFYDEEWSADEAKELGNVFYDAYLEGSSKLLRLLDDAIERVLARQQELLGEPDFARLFRQWRQDRSYARASRWRDTHVGAAVSDDVDAELAEFDRLFFSVLHDADTTHLSRAKNHGSLSVLKRRAALLFKHKKAAELQDLLVGLAKRDDADAVQWHRLLIEGYLAELQAHQVEALDCYQKIIAAGESLLEEALSRVAHISLERSDAANAYLALQCLSQVNPVHLPFYAEIQRISGETMAAIDSYHVYVEQFPDDTFTQIKLATLYIDNKIYDGAQLMLDFVLNKHPDMEAALKLRAGLPAG